MNMTGEDLRLKWGKLFMPTAVSIKCGLRNLLCCFTGVGRILAEAKKLPIILPMWMIGKCVQLTHKQSPQ